MNQTNSVVPFPISLNIPQLTADDLLSREWLLSNPLGAYASSTVVGCNTRRYHGLLVAATNPPVGRVVALSHVLERLVVNGKATELATNEFDGAFAPQGWRLMTEFRNDSAVTFVYRFENVELTKEVLLSETTQAVAVRYAVRGENVELQLRPFAAMRDFHGLRQFTRGGDLTFTTFDRGLTVEDRSQAGLVLTLFSREAEIRPDTQWWYKFRYRSDLARGQDGHEDLYSPGWFVYRLADGQSCQFTASLGADMSALPMGFATLRDRRAERLAGLAAAVGPDADETARRLAMAGDAFIAHRRLPDGSAGATIFAGYHWFADWGRDTFIALPGLLLATKRFDVARQVFSTFARHQADGMLPNRFDDYSPTAHYNSIDASLWFVLAAERYMQAAGDATFWRDVLLPACAGVLKWYRNGTRFDIRADADGLLCGGSAKTQLTWMDAQFDGQPITPRQGKAVEINALWYAAHCIVANRAQGLDDALAARCAEQAELIAQAFRKAFWNPQRECLFDCVTDSHSDDSIRPNQIFAVSLPFSPLTAQQQAAVLKMVETRLLTPYGLRTLDAADGRYRRRYGESWESRDRAYHQGTVWAWLIGAFVEAYLRVEGAKPFAVERARNLLVGFDEHLLHAGLGFVSEIFDADAPHDPHGCIAQAWSVGEVLRAKMLVAEAAAAEKAGASPAKPKPVRGRKR